MDQTTKKLAEYTADTLLIKELETDIRHRNIPLRFYKKTKTGGFWLDYKELVQAASFIKKNNLNKEFMENIYFVNGKLSVDSFMVTHLMRITGELINIDEYLFDENGKRINEENGNLTAKAFGAVCTVHRKGFTSPVTKRFTVDNARQAKLYQEEPHETKQGKKYLSIWQKWLEDMMPHKARIRAVRVAFPEVFSGVNIQEEQEKGGSSLEPKDIDSESDVMQTLSGGGSLKEPSGKAPIEAKSGNVGVNPAPPTNNEGGGRDPDNAGSQPVNSKISCETPPTNSGDKNSQDKAREAPAELQSAESARVSLQSKLAGGGPGTGQPVELDREEKEKLGEFRALEKKCRELNLITADKQFTDKFLIRPFPYNLDVHIQRAKELLEGK